MHSGIDRTAGFETVFADDWPANQISCYSSDLISGYLDRRSRGRGNVHPEKYNFVLSGRLLVYDLKRRFLLKKPK